MTCDNLLTDILTFGTLYYAFAFVAFAPHYRVYRRGTYYPIKRILNTTSESELRSELQRWRRYKEHEAGYVQVAGAVIFASVSSCLSWEDAVRSSHWSGPALWYSSIVLALASIFSGAQQSLVLPEADIMAEMSSDEVEKMKNAFTGGTLSFDEPSVTVLVAWQIPIMLLGYSVFSFIAGLCSVVLSPLANKPGWNVEAKTAVMFITVSTFSLICWAFPSRHVHRIRSPRV